MPSSDTPDWLIYCRAGFERDCVEETQAKPIEVQPNAGYALLAGKPRLSYKSLAFTRQLIHVLCDIKDLPERDRLTPILAAIPAEPVQFSALWLEVPDTNEGKTLSGFTRRFGPLLEEKLRAAGRLAADADAPRLHVFFPGNNRAIIGTTDPHNSAAFLMGIPRLKMSREAPSRSYLKLAEAFEVLLDADERRAWLKPGMKAVDLGAAPGGWTWYLAERGLKVTAVDNGPMKGAAAGHPAIRHLRADGFNYRPKQPVDWLVCDMVERPARVAALMADWLAKGHADRALFNLKLPMKKRAEALSDAVSSINAVLGAKGTRPTLHIKQLYHDREEVTVLLARTKR